MHFVFLAMTTLKEKMNTLPSQNKVILETIFSSASHLKQIQSNSVDLVVTSPPYPMIEMWDAIFSKQDANIGKLLKKKETDGAFEKMHKLLDMTWKEVYRVLKSGGIVCINIGDAVRSFDANFCLYSNHSRILQSLSNIGFHFLPDILWHKETNAPNKFMGSGMLPVSAYVTYEHEYILIARKISKREFTTEQEKQQRRESAFFWEERNVWFSDIWRDIKGVSQKNENKKEPLRSAAFPFELAYRLILMFSVKNDLVLDPFLGTGTTLEAAAVGQRNAIGVEINRSYRELISKKIMQVHRKSKKINQDRIAAHIQFVKEHSKKKGSLKYKNPYHNFSVVTSQETDLRIDDVSKVEQKSKEKYQVSYASPKSNSN